MYDEYIFSEIFCKTEVCEQKLEKNQHKSAQLKQKIILIEYNNKYVILLYIIMGQRNKYNLKSRKI